MDTQETEITEEGGQETEEEGPGLQGNEFGARRKTNRKGKKNKKKKKKRDPGKVIIEKSRGGRFFMEKELRFGLPS